ncbi:hypothetical protein V6N13_074494 [Hibiscus sabdariffa]
MNGDARHDPERCEESHVSQAKYFGRERFSVFRDTSLPRNFRRGGVKHLNGLTSALLQVAQAFPRAFDMPRETPVERLR